MKSKMMLLLAVLFILAVPAFAQEAAEAKPVSGGFVLSVGFAMAIASGLCGLGQGRAIGSAAEGIARNPGAGDAIRVALLLGLAFIESLALLTFVIILLRG